MVDALHGWSNEGAAATHEDTTEPQADAEVVAGDAELVRAVTAGPAVGASMPPHVLAAMHQRFGNAFVAELLARRAEASAAPAADAATGDGATHDEDAGGDLDATSAQQHISDEVAAGEPAAVAADDTAVAADEPAAVARTSNEVEPMAEPADADSERAPASTPDHDHAPVHALARDGGGPAATAQERRAEHPARPAEPLPVLKEIAASTSARNLRGLLRLIAHAPARARLGLRTPISRQDGLTTIVTAFVLRAAMRQFQAASPADRKKLQRIVGNHLRLTGTARAAGGLRVPSVGGGPLSGLAGPTSNGFSVETVNQTAVMLVTLHQLRRDPAFAAHRPVVRAQWARFEPEFRHLLLRCYPPGQHPRTWRYGISPDRPSYGRHEDQSHLKTTYQQLRRLVELEAPNAPWCQRQADRIEAAYPLVNAPWDQLGSHDGSIR